MTTKPLWLLTLLAAFASPLAASWFGVCKPLTLNDQLTADKLMSTFEKVMKAEGLEQIPARPPTTIWQMKGGDDATAVRVSLSIPPGGSTVMVSLINRGGDDQGPQLTKVQQALSAELVKLGGKPIEVNNTMK